MPDSIPDASLMHHDDDPRQVFTVWQIKWCSMGTGTGRRCMIYKYLPDS